MARHRVSPESLAGQAPVRAPAFTAPSRTAADTVPIEHESLDRVVRTLVFGVPPAALAVAAWLAWGGTLHGRDLIVLAVTYTLTGLGVTVGYHRLFTHRSFK